MVLENETLVAPSKRITAAELKRVKLQLLAAQDFKCALCSINMLDDLENACVDHCHSTGFVRAVLCRNCNRGEGKVKTIATQCKRTGTMLTWLAELVSYWQLHQKPQTRFIHPKHKTEDEKRLRRNARARARRKELKNAND